MTIVCCWLQDGVTPSSIVMASDSRASIRTKEGSWAPYTEDLIKIYSVPVRCRNLPNGAAPDESWAIYFETSLLVGFCGDVFEATTIIGLAKRFFRRLVGFNGATPKPSFSEMAERFEDIARRFRSRRCIKLKEEVEPCFLLVGYCPQSSKPMGALIECRSKIHLTSFPLAIGQPWMIGEGAKQAEDASRKLQTRIKKARAEFVCKHGREQDADVEEARRGHAMNKQLEQEIVDAIGEEFRVTIGGYLDKAELFLGSAGTGIADFTHGSIAENLLSAVAPIAGGQLHYVHLVQRTGR